MPKHQPFLNNKVKERPKRNTEKNLLKNEDNEIEKTAVGNMPNNIQIMQRPPGERSRKNDEIIPKKPPSDSAEKFHKLANKYLSNLTIEPGISSKTDKAGPLKPKIAMLDNLEQIEKWPSTFGTYRPIPGLEPFFQLLIHKRWARPENSDAPLSFINVCAMIRNENQTVNKKKHRPEVYDVVLKSGIGQTDIRMAVEEAVYGLRSRLKAPESPIPISSNSIAFLATEYIHPLKNPGSRFSEAVYFCRICEYHLSTIAHVRQHIQHTDHVAAILELSKRKYLRCIPTPNAAHCRAISRTLLQLDVGKSPEQLLFCIELTDLLQQYTVRMYGSSLTGMALKDGDVNLELVFKDQDVNHAELLNSAMSQLQLLPDYTHVQGDFSHPWPGVRFQVTSIPVDCQCFLSVCNQSAFQLARLLRCYVQLCPQLAQLASSVRHWAKLCGLMDTSIATLPSYAFDIMLVHYLQQCDYLPVLDLHQFDQVEDDQNDCTYEQDSEMMSETSREWNLGEVWFRFFKYYAVERENSEFIIQIRQKEHVHRDENNWFRKRLAIEDPFFPQKNVSKLSSANFGFLMHCFQTTYLYFGIPCNRNGPFVIFDFEKRSFIVSFHCELHAGLIRLYSLKESVSNLSLNADQNLSESRVYDRKFMLEIGKIPTETQIREHLPALIRNLGDHMGNIGVFNQTSESDLESDANVVELEPDVNLTIDRPSKDTSIHFKVISESDLAPMLARVHLDDYVFIFKAENFAIFEKPQVVCDLCKVVGHFETICEESISNTVIARLPPLSKFYLSRLDDVIYNIYKMNSISADQRQLVENIRRLVQCSIRGLFPSGCRIDLFGSTVNGFGYRLGDIDLCLRFQEDIMPLSVDPCAVIRSVDNCLSKISDFVDVTSITTAKVPIVKFRLVKYPVKGDISLYNVLALRNTALLSTYAHMDFRVALLGVMLKTWAQECDIGDASKGGLSSYAYIIMLIHYLQHCQPPVLPFLQEAAINVHLGILFISCRIQMERVGGDGQLKKDLVDNWDTYFYSDTGRLV